ncbi:hypothetical protein GCM10023194_53110 [Planotetraspora phitsanulokensis]|uniref:Uncharacterized protein n=1 Tax=Planotetraspora phitsanulokensis TaxID=575192 RepID=A0A8J3XIR9_9ACTN|nr:hypothetical protein Pph01_76520 [Planotetraspora phitsanulokensis]
MAVALQVAGDDLCHGRVVVDDQDTCGIASHQTPRDGLSQRYDRYAIPSEARHQTVRLPRRPLSRVIMHRFAAGVIHVKLMGRV